MNWVLDADIRDFFGQLDRAWLRRFLEHRIADRGVLRLVDKWLAAGVVEDGDLVADRAGFSAGSIGIAAARQRVPALRLRPVGRIGGDDHEARGDVIIVRFADDFIVGFQHRDDADRFLTALRDRFAKFGLELHPDKTRLIEFGRYAAERRRRGGWVSRRRSTSWVSRTSARHRAGAVLGSAHDDRNGCGPS